MISNLDVMTKKLEYPSSVVVGKDTKKRMIHPIVTKIININYGGGKTEMGIITEVKISPNYRGIVLVQVENPSKYGRRILEMRIPEYRELRDKGRVTFNDNIITT